MKDGTSSEESRNADLHGPQESTRISSAGGDRASLEVKLEALIEEMRLEIAAERLSAPEAKGASVHVAGILPPASYEVFELAAPKLIFASDVDPRQETTVVCRRAIDGAEEEPPPLLRISATHSDAPFERSSPPQDGGRKRASIVAIAALGIGLTLGGFGLTNLAAPPARHLARAFGPSLVSVPRSDAVPEPSASALPRLTRVESAPAPEDSALTTAQPLRPPPRKHKTPEAAPRPTTRAIGHRRQTSLGSGPKY